jgi:hypothetical protein
MGVFELFSINHPALRAMVDDDLAGGRYPFEA